MRYLLDTHAVIWVARNERHRFSPQIAGLLDRTPSSIHVSAASAWEIATKNRLGKLPGMGGYLDSFEERLAVAGFTGLSMTIQHGILAGRLEGDHKDPFDRYLAAQALLENLTLLSNDKALDAFGVKRIW